MMPKITLPGDGPDAGPSLDLSPDLREMTKTLKDNLTARTTADIYTKLTQPSDSSLPVMQGLGEALGGLAQGWKGVSEMQQTLQTQVMERLQQGPGGGGVDDLMKYLLVWKMIREMSDDEPRRAKSDEDGPSWRDLLQLQEQRQKDIREAERQASQDPVRDQLMGAFVGTLAQTLQQSLTPSNPVDQLKQAHEMVNTITRDLGADGRTTLQDRRLERLDQMELRKLELDYADRHEDREARRALWQQDLPAVAQTVLGGLNQLAAGLGFAPTTPGPRLVSPEAMAAAQGAGSRQEASA
jgi:hypothetical protein